MEDYFLYIDDLPYPEKVRIYGLVSFFFLLWGLGGGGEGVVAVFEQIESFNVIHLKTNGSKKLRKLHDHFLMLLEMTIQFVARVR